MGTRLFRKREMAFTPHPRFANVQWARFISGKDTNTVSVCLVEIQPNTSIPIHIHDPQVDSMLVLSGKGEAYVNGTWEPVEAGDYIFVSQASEHALKNTGNEWLRIFVHHSPPLQWESGGTG